MTFFVAAFLLLREEVVESEIETTIVEEKASII